MLAQGILIAEIFFVSTSLTIGSLAESNGPEESMGRPHK
jgi:hypothetical protein